MKFIQKLNLDKPVIEDYKLMRTLLKKYNVTESQSQQMFAMPVELSIARHNIQSSYANLKENLRKYGFLGETNKVPVDVALYLEREFMKIDKEISLEGNTGYYGNRTEV